MRRQARPFVVRARYPHRLAAACQHFAGFVLVLRPESFASDVRRFLGEAPVPLNPAETIYRWIKVNETVSRGAMCYHSWFHATFGPAPCTFAPTALPAPQTYIRAETDRVVMDWAHAIDEAFERAHVWPPAVRAARLLERDPATNWYVSDLARAVNASVATLERSFDRIYRLTVQQYQSLLRVRAAVVAVRGDQARLEGHLWDLGCRHANDVYRPLRRLTGLTLGQVRHLDDDAFHTLMSGPLVLPLPGFSTTHIRES